MGKGSPVSSIVVFAIYMGTGCLSKELEERCYHLKKTSPYGIDWFRIAPFRLVDSTIFDCSCRCIIINSFAFFVVVSDNKDGSKELESIKNTTIEKYKNAIELNENGKVWLKRDDNFFLDSWLGNKYLRDDFLQKREKKNKHDCMILTLERVEIEKGDFTKIESVSAELMSNKDDLIDCYQRLIIAIEGYENEEREPYQSREFQRYFRQVLNEFPEIIWVLLLDENIITVQMMVWAYVNENYTDDVNNNTTDVHVSREKSIQLLEKCFMAINNLTNMYAFDFSRNQELTHKFQNIYNKSLGIE